MLAELAEADSMDSAASSHHASFPDVVCMEQQKAEGVSRVLSSWSSTDGKLSEAFLASPGESWRLLALFGFESGAPCKLSISFCQDFESVQWYS